MMISQTRYSRLIIYGVIVWSVIIHATIISSAIILYQMRAHNGSLRKADDCRVNNLNDGVHCKIICHYHTHTLSKVDKCQGHNDPSQYYIHYDPQFGYQISTYQNYTIMCLILGFSLLLLVGIIYSVYTTIPLKNNAQDNINRDPYQNATLLHTIPQP